MEPTSQPPSVPVTKSNSPRAKKPQNKKEPLGKQGGPANQKGVGKLRGLEKDSEDVRISKTLSWLLRHGAQGEGLPIRADGYANVVDVLNHPKFKSHSVDLGKIQELVKADSKQRYDLIFEHNTPSEDPNVGVWWIRANQGHSLKNVKVEVTPITSVSDIPTGVAVHGTNKKAWDSIATQGLSKMKRNHIHLAQGVAGDTVISGMRSSAEILIFINVQKALEAGIKFFMSRNGVVLTDGDEKGFLKPEFFQRVENSKGVAIPGWEGTVKSTSASVPVTGGYETPSAIEKPEIQEGVEKLSIK